MEKKNSDAKTDIFDEIRDWAEASSVSQEELRAWFDMLRRQTTPGSVFDAVFHTEVRRLSRLIILLINHLFGTHYTGDEKVLYGATEQPVRFPGGFYRLRRADSHFTIITSDGCQHVYHVECQTADDGSILLRVAEYDFMLALDHVSDGDAFIEIPLPESAVVYLRSPAQKRRKLRYRITDSADRFVEQTIRTIAVQEHTVSDLFVPELFALLPFYLFTHSSEQLKALQDSTEGCSRLLGEADNFADRILKEESLRETEKSQLLELTQQVVQALIRNITLKEEMEKAMNAAMITLSTDKMIDEIEAKAHEELRQAQAKAHEEGRMEGRVEGRKDQLNEIIRHMLKEKQEPAFISRMLGVSVRYVEEIRTACDA